MGKRFSFEFKITGIILVVFTLVSIIGIYAYRQITELVTSISEKTLPDMTLVVANTMANDLSEAENNIKSFSLTGDSIYFYQFIESEKRVENRLAELRSLSNITSVEFSEIDSLDLLVQEKFAILRELLTVQDQFRAQEALDKVYDELERAAEDDVENPDDERGGIFRRSKRKKKANDANEDQTIDNISMEDVTEEVRKIKAEEDKIEDQVKALELELILRGKIVSDRIRATIDNMEVEEQMAIATETKNSEIAMRNTNRQIAIFCVAAGLLLLFTLFIIINYVRNNNMYRAALKRAKKEAEELASTKEKFIATVSHEIRTPMNAIAGFTEQLAKGSLNDEQREQLRVVRKSTNHLLQLINDVLDFTKLESGKLQIEQVGFNPETEIKDVVHFVKPLAEAKDLKVVYAVDKEVPSVLVSDPYRLRQILLNLLSNSIKFTHEGTITIEASTILQGEDNTTLRIEVQDTGIGMTEEQRAKVFDEFEQAETSTTRNYGGTGLGLSIVNMLVKLFDGKIELKSEPNVGTNISIEIPCKIGTEQAISSKRVEKTASDTELPKGLKVLVVDDELYNRKLLTTILKKQHAVFTEAADGIEALKELEKNNYDLILMDARMPNMNGIEATIEIRKMVDPEKAKIPILVLTAAVTTQDRKQYVLAGMDGFVAKPFKEQELFTRILEVLRGQKSSLPQDTIDQMTAEAPADLSELKKMSAGDPSFYKDMIVTFVEGTRAGIQSIRDACDKRDWANMAEYAHKISSPCRHLSVDSLYQTLKEIENDCRNELTPTAEQVTQRIELVERAELEAREVLLWFEHELNRESEEISSQNPT